MISVLREKKKIEQMKSEIPLWDTIFFCEIIYQTESYYALLVYNISKDKVRHKIGKCCMLNDYFN